MLHVILVHSIRDKSENISSKDNYWLIASASILKQTCTKATAELHGNSLSTTPNEFGFKKEYRTDDRLKALKEIIEYYLPLIGSISLCLLYTCKAFDHVSHNVLFAKIGIRGAPKYAIRFLIYLYSYHWICVRWGASLYRSSNVSKGVKQE